MSESVPIRDSYLALIDEIVESTLQGKISSVEMVYQILQNKIKAGTGEIFELVLSDRLTSIQSQVDTQTDELKKAKANRKLRAVKTIQTQWQRYSQHYQTTEAIASAIKEITTAATDERLTIFLRVIDPNQKQPLNIQSTKQLASGLQQFAQVDTDLQEISQGITRGLANWERLQEHLVSWMYESNQQLGFGGVPTETGPWATWAKQVNSNVCQALFRALAREQSVWEFAQQQGSISLSDWVELGLILQYLQRGLVNWFDQQAYNVQAGSKLSISTFLTFAVIWSQLATGFDHQPMYSHGCSQVMLQNLRNFAQRPYFPLYGGIFASFSGGYLRDALDYLDEPLRRVEGNQQKARILTLLGYSQRALGQYQRSIAFHQQALEIARNAGDLPCELANLNHLSRTYVQQKNYAQAINYSQRALMLSRQGGERTAQANALVNLGYSQVMEAQQLEQVETEVYETAINYLEQGLKLSEQLGDIQSKALCFSSLGIAYLVIGQSSAAIPYLENGFNTAQVAGDLYLQGRNLAYLSEAYYNLQNSEKAIYTGSLGMYLLKQIASSEWRQIAGLLTILQGQIGGEAFQELLKQHRPKMMAIIGVDGYDYIPHLLAEYQDNM
ncbi:tetratricopeptide repeat protein [Anabaenopsis elenkinii]|uniref:Tetratricopeptide repeat protein n=1 Tax=Anabaenopsis elenkinii CCIBt3563 TaxID=2779889 RepID=A0A7U3NL79_9CYAN|nr:tetratricopeptide repeat protein [Anabaenopsis elenkinii]QOV21317.1 tetratricopeptide repeat protein [Anabaenopsis elenkinii CCIBt3563]QOV23259.1 tetratricopeptide repeat protein [Anabaenopsis elenkinii CCIBt3563]